MPNERLHSRGSNPEERYEDERRYHEDDRRYPHDDGKYDNDHRRHDRRRNDENEQVTKPSMEEMIISESNKQFLQQPSPSQAFNPRVPPPPRLSGILPPQSSSAVNLLTAHGLHQNIPPANTTLPPADEGRGYPSALVHEENKRGYDGSLFLDGKESANSANAKANSATAKTVPLNTKSTSVNPFNKPEVKTPKLQNERSQATSTAKILGAPVISPQNNPVASKVCFQIFLILLDRIFFTMEAYL